MGRRGTDASKINEEVTIHGNGGLHTSFFSSSDPRHADAIKIYNEEKCNALAAADYTFDGALGSKRKLSRWNAVKTGGETLKMLDAIKVGHEDFMEGWKIFKKHGKLSFTESVTLAITRRL